METQKLPYEVLIRFDQSGAVQGAHVVWAYKITDGNAVLAYQPGSAETAGAAGSDFPLTDAVNAAIVQGLHDRATEIATHEATVAALTDTNNAQAEQIADLYGQIAALTATSGA